MNDRGALGRWGEALAAQYLRAQGCSILAANYRCRNGEIDLIADDGRYLLFVEVKLRKDDRCGAAEEFVTPAKRQRIVTTAQAWMQTHPMRRQPRFDVIALYAPQGTATERPELRWIQAAYDT